MIKISYQFKRFIDLTDNELEQMRVQVADDFPNLEAFKTRFYYQVPPEYMILATHGDRVVGQFYITFKALWVADKMRVVAALGVSIAHEYRGLGIATAMIRQALEFVTDKAELIIATTENPVAADILIKHGFEMFEGDAKFTDIENHSTIDETYSVYIHDHNQIMTDHQGVLYMGFGAW